MNGTYLGDFSKYFFNIVAGQVLYGPYFNPAEQFGRVPPPFYKQMMFREQYEFRYYYQLRYHASELPDTFLIKAPGISKFIEQVDISRFQ